MVRASLLATVMLVAVSSSTAHAGGYVGLGVGTSPSINSEQESRFDTDGRSAKVLGGFRFGQWSAEGSIGGFEFTRDITVYQAQAAGKFNFPLGSGFEVFGKAGLQHVMLRRGSDTTDPSLEMSGNGYLLGAGFEYRIKTPFASGSIFVDYTYATSSLEREDAKYDLSTRMWTLGLTVGI